MSKKVIIILILTVLSIVIGLGVYNFYQTYEYKEKTIHLGFKGEARTNPLYAARLFLKRMGIKTETKETIQNINDLPDTDTVLLIDSSRSTLSSQKTLKLIDWVKSGGHIIARTTRDWKYSGSEKIDDIKKSKKYSPDPLQRYLGVRTGDRIDIEDSDDEEIDTILNEFTDSGLLTTEAINAKNTREIKLNDVEKILSINLSRYRTILLDEDIEDITEKVELEDGTFIIRQKVGEGLITLVSNMSFIENRSIENADHAEILWHLIHGLHKPLSQPQAVWLITNDEMPSLWDILWDKTWAFILSLLLLFGAWLLRSTHRFGPMIPKKAEDRRSLNEHISSSGNYYWKHKNKSKLIESSRDALLHRLARIHPGWEQRTKEEQIILLAEHTKMKPESLQKLLFSDTNNPSFEQAETFTQLITDIEKIRNNL